MLFSVIAIIVNIGIAGVLVIIDDSRSEPRGKRGHSISGRSESNSIRSKPEKKIGFTRYRMSSRRMIAEDLHTKAIGKSF